MTVDRLTEMMGPFDISSKWQSCTRGLWNRRQPLASSRRTDIPPPHWARTWGSWRVSESSGGWNLRRRLWPLCSYHGWWF